MDQDFEFNLPAVLGLPTAHEVRNRAHTLDHVGFHVAEFADRIEIIEGRKIGKSVSCEIKYSVPSVPALLEEARMWSIVRALSPGAVAVREFTW